MGRHEISLYYKVFGYKSSIKNTEEFLRPYLVSFLSGFSLEVVNHSSEQSNWEESVIRVLRYFIARSWHLQQAHLVLHMTSIKTKKGLKHKAHIEVRKTRIQFQFNDMHLFSKVNAASTRMRCFHRVSTHCTMLRSPFYSVPAKLISFKHCTKQ